MKDLLKLIACLIAFVLAIFVTGFVSGLLHLSFSNPQPTASMAAQLLAQLIGGAVLVIGVYPLARGLTASVPVRALAVGSFLFLALGVNGIIEAKKFTHFLDGGVAGAVAFYIAIAVLVGAAFGYFFGHAGHPAGLTHRALPAWLWRAAAAWLGWPFIYFFFGACIAPIIVPYYNAGIAGLRIPPLNVVFETQLIRSVFFLASSLPFIALWKGSRRNLWLALGMAHAFIVGLFGIVAATFLPMVLRITHSAEITCDSFAYAGLLVLLFSAPAKISAKEFSPAQVSPLEAHPSR
jgi:hypothetical protein